MVAEAPNNVRERRNALGAALAVAAFLAAAPGVVAAESVTGQLIRQLNRQMLYMAVPIAVLVEVILVYAVLRFRGSDAPQPTRDNRQLEITWTVATALVLVFVGTASFTALAHPYVGDVPAEATLSEGGGSGGHHSANGIAPGNAPGNATEVVGLAQQFNWTFRYPETGRTAEELVLPRDREVYIYVTSGDVLHSMHVPDLGLKQDAFPGQYNLIRTEVLENGTYRLYCAEFCGTNHATMQSTVRVVDPDQFDRWVASGSGNETLPGSDAEEESEG